MAEHLKLMLGGCCQLMNSKFQVNRDSNTILGQIQFFLCV
jgi:hypothetical protein